MYDSGFTGWRSYTNLSRSHTIVNLPPKTARYDEGNDPPNHRHIGPCCTVMYRHIREALRSVIRRPFCLLCGCKPPRFLE